MILGSHPSPGRLGRKCLAIANTLALSDTELKFYSERHCGLYYKPVMIVNDDSRVVNKLEASLTDDARVVIYNHHMFIVQAIGVKVIGVKRLG
jgi:hypothetical protein